MVPQGQQQFADPPLGLIEVSGTPDLIGVGGIGFLVLALALEAALAQWLQVLRVGDSAPLRGDLQVHLKNHPVLLRGPAALQAEARCQGLPTALQAQRGKARRPVLRRPATQLIPRAAVTGALGDVKMRPDAADDPAGRHAGGGSGAQEELYLGGGRRT